MVFIIFLIVCQGAFSQAASSPNWIETPVLNAIDYFATMQNYFLKIALDLGRLLAVMGFVWTSLQVAMGQKQMAGMLIGTAMKWLSFFLIMTLYPGFTVGLRKLCTEIGNNASGMSVSFINRELTEYITNIENLMNSTKDKMVEFDFDQDEVFQRRAAEIK